MSEFAQQLEGFPKKRDINSNKSSRAYVMIFYEFFYGMQII